MAVNMAELARRARRADKLLERGREVDLSDEDFCRRLMAHYDGIEAALLGEEDSDTDFDPSPGGRGKSAAKAALGRGGDAGAGGSPSPAGRGEKMEGGNAAFDEDFREFQNAGPWPLPELAPMAIDEVEHEELQRFAHVTSPQQLTMMFLEEWLPIELRRLHGIFSPAHLFVLTLREYCRAELTLLCDSHDAEIAFDASCRLFRYEERLRARFQQLKSRGGCELDEGAPYRHCNAREAALLKDEEREAAAPAGKAGRAAFARALAVRNRVIDKNSEDVIEACLRRASWWLGLVLGARSARDLFAKLSREANLFDRLSPTPPLRGKERPHLPRAMRLPVAMALSNALYQIRHEGGDAARLKWTSRLYRVLLARTHGVEAAAAFTPVMASARWPGMPAADECDGVVIEMDTAGEVPDAGERAPP